MKTSTLWKTYIGKQIVVVIDDKPYPRKKDGILLDVDDSHIFIQTIYKPEPIIISRSSIKRIEIQKNE